MGSLVPAMRPTRRLAHGPQTILLAEVLAPDGRGELRRVRHKMRRYNCRAARELVLRPVERDRRDIVASCVEPLDRQARGARPRPETRLKRKLISE